jgi:hypothetical protein
MEPDQTAQPHNILFDERQECWYVTTDESQRLPLSRDSIHHMVSLFNEIHRGNPITVMDQKAVEELGDERRELHETIWNLYDFIDANASGDDKSPDSLVADEAPRSMIQIALSRLGEMLSSIFDRK